MRSNFLTNRFLPLGASIYSYNPQIAKSGPPPDTFDFLITEFVDGGDFITTEGGSFLIVETASIEADFIVTETGNFVITETGNFVVTEV